jgi:trehalose 6-phosphate synthase/phosphatase
MPNRTTDCTRPVPLPRRQYLPGREARARARLGAAVARWMSAHWAHLLLDYDGTLVDLAATPAEAGPDAELLDLVWRLASSSWLDLHIISGRPRADLEAWFDRGRVSLWAEHAFWRRLAGDRAWRAAVRPRPASMRAVAALLDEAVARTPGSWVEGHASLGRFDPGFAAGHRP